MVYCFVILNYLAFEETMECVNTIRRLHAPGKKHILIVDNGSQNDSSKKLNQTYSDDGEITIIELDCNIGFARGNNVGYQWCKEHYANCFIILCNSDLLFDQIDFLDRLNEKYKCSAFDIVGPDVRRPLPGKIIQHQNPHKMELETITEIEKIIDDMRRKIDLLENDNNYRRRFILYSQKERAKNICKKKFSPIYGLLRRKKNSEDIENWGREHINCILHGSCLIFSPKYICQHDLAFDERTFLYCEEKLLYLHNRIEGGIMLYTPELHVTHKHGLSTKKISKNNIEVELFVLRNSLLSYCVLLDEVNKNQLVN